MASLYAEWSKREKDSSVKEEEEEEEEENGTRDGNERREKRRRVTVKQSERKKEDAWRLLKRSLCAPLQWRPMAPDAVQGQEKTGLACWQCLDDAAGHWPRWPACCGKAVAGKCWKSLLPPCQWQLRPLLQFTSLSGKARVASEWKRDGAFSGGAKAPGETCWQEAKALPGRWTNESTAHFTPTATITNCPWRCHSTFIHRISTSIKKEKGKKEAPAFSSTIYVYSHNAA